MWIAAIAGALLAVAATVLVLNFTGGEKRIERKLEHGHAVGDAQFQREIGTLLGPPILGGNRVVNLENGDEIFPAMLETIRGAERTLCLETYVYWTGEIAEEVADG